MLDDPNKPPYAGNFFVGVPAPAGALIVMLPVYLELIGLPRTGVSPAFALLYTIGIALLMVSSLPPGRANAFPLTCARLCAADLCCGAPGGVVGELSVGAAHGRHRRLSRLHPLAYMHYKKLEHAHLARRLGRGAAFSCRGRKKTRVPTGSIRPDFRPGHRCAALCALPCAPSKA